MAKEKKGLGVGLDILFGSDSFDDSESELLTLPISKVEPRLEQPREHFDEEALEALAAQYGLIQPITVRKLDTGYYQIIAGERRWRASRLAGLTEVPVRVIEADDRRTAELALVENLQREDLNPIEEAKGFKLLIDEYGLTQDEAAKSVGRSRPAVTNSLRLLSLSKSVLQMVEKNELSAGHARALLTITDEKKQLARIIYNFFYNVLPSERRPYPDGLYFTDAIEMIRSQLDDSKKVEDIYRMMLSVWENSSTDDRYFDLRKKGIDSIIAYRNGTFSLFGKSKHAECIA